MQAGVIFSIFSGNRKNSITNQINEQIKFLEKGVDKKYIAYFQNFTGTYGNIDYLRTIYEEAIKHPNIVGIAIATRADCLSEEVLELLSEFNEIPDFFECEMCNKELPAIENAVMIYKVMIG